MAEFIGTEEKFIDIDKPVIFENNTDSDFSVSAAIVFRKSGLYDVSIVGRRTIISKVAERPKGYMKIEANIIDGEDVICEACGAYCLSPLYKFCPKCGVEFIGVRGIQDE